MSDKSDSGKLLSQLHLASAYERKARLAPALLALIFGLPGALAWGIAATGWITAIIAGAGIGIVVAIGLSHLASAMGNSFQEKLWPRWPFDSPTNIRLKPGNGVVSEQQRLKWCTALGRITGLDLHAEEVNERESERLVQDAIAESRAILWGLEVSSRLATHNADYGFARNFAGMRPIWLFLAGASMIASWGALFLNQGGYFWAVSSTLLFVFAVYLAFALVSRYVKKRADYYAESFFAAVLELDRKNSPSGWGSPEN